MLEVINGFYAAALDRLPVEEMPVLVPRLLKAGLCVGFSDPVSNIVLNTISYRHRVPGRNPAVPPGGGAKIAATTRRRKKALSRAVVDTTGDNAKYWPPPHRTLLPDMPIAVRSLEALVAFLTYYFRYLPSWEALEYLRLANDDLLAAVRLVEEDRNSGGGFSFASGTAKTALRCAALATCHPKPRALVNRSYSLASRMEQVSQILAAEGGRLSCTAVETIYGLLKRRRRKLPCVAGVTPPRFLPQKNLQPSLSVPTKSIIIKSVLLDKIYGFYIDALASLPRDDLRNRYHRGLLKAGHCYGSMKNPVSNIVLNTVWYETMFPPQEELTAAMICSRSLVRVACRSLRGLVAYIRICFRMVSKQQAMRYLLFAEVNLWGAIEMARLEGHAERTMLNQQDGAYNDAATAAQHPDPDAVVGVFVS